VHSIFTDSIEIGSWCGGGGENHDYVDTSNLAVFSIGASDFFLETIYQDMLVTGITEAFTEGESRHDTLADTYVSFSTGANPTAVTISGFLIKGLDEDNSAAFMAAYDSYMRGTAVERQSLHLHFLLKKTRSFKFSLHSLSVGDTVSRPGMTQVVLTGIAYDYAVVPVIDTYEETTTSE
jgi:hypothetical protein